MDVQLDDDDSHIKLDGRSFFVINDEVCNGYDVLEHGTNKDVASLPFKVVCKLCQDMQSIWFSKKQKKQLVEALLIYVSLALYAVASSVLCHNISSVQLMGGPPRELLKMERTSAWSLPLSKEMT